MKIPAAAILVAFTLVCVPESSRAQDAARQPGWHDDLVDHMAGRWNLEGTLLGSPAHHTVTAEWILNHQFLRLIEKTSATAPASEAKYEAHWFIGYDAVSERYVTHLLDVLGARDSETLGYGTRRGNSIAFVFEYPDGPFHTTFEWLPQENAWHWLLEQKDESGKWSMFGDVKLTRADASR